MKTKNITKTFIGIIFSFVGIFTFGNVDAIDKFPDKISGNISSADTLNYGGLNLFKKEYSSTSTNHQGKAFCSAFQRVAPGQYPLYQARTCSKTTFSSNPSTNERVAASIGAIVNKARSLSGGTGSINWENYYYAELAINQFLYSGYNGKKGFGAAVNNIGNASTATKNKMQPYITAANYQYNNFKRTTVTVLPKYVGNTVEATVTCKDYAGKVKTCSITATAVVNIDGTSHNVTPKVSGNKITIDLNSLIGGLSDQANHSIETEVKVVDKVVYTSAQNYNCGKDSNGNVLQSLIPNFLETNSYTVSDSKKITKTVAGSGSLTIKKFDSSTGNFLDETIVEIYQNNKLILVEEVLSQDGLQIENLSFGTYCIKEIGKKSGYKLDKYTVDGADANPGSNGVCVELKDGKATSNINVYNKKDLTTLKVNKLDADGKAVKGAKLRVFYIDIIEGQNSNSTSEGDNYVVDNNQYNAVDVASWITDGNAKTLEVEVGKTYMVVEDVPPEGYTPVVSSLEITASSDASKNVVTLTNVYSSFKISKQDITNKKELPGAKLEIRDERGLVVASWISTEAPQEITGLIDGNYTLTETTAPNGYSVSESINFTIEKGKLKDDDDNTLVMYDKLVVSVPDTFSTKNIITMLIGLIMVGAGTGVLIYEFKKKKTA